jgi:O-antigen/teichoic acid export membrane protein
MNADVKGRTVAGIRWSILFGAATMPLSFVTNMILGRSLPEALGYYAAIQIFLGTFQAFFVPGGRDVFTRFVPALEPRRRSSFLMSYLATVVGIVAAGYLVLLTLAPGALTWIRGYYNIPTVFPVLAFCLIYVLWSFASHFLYGVLEAPRAAFTLRSVVFGFFLLAGAAVWPLRDRLVSDPASYLWWGAIGIYGVAAAIGLALAARAIDFRRFREWRWFLPSGFWPVALYTHAGTVITFSYTSLTPAFVLLWLDVPTLARLHAALRFNVLLSAIPVMVAPVLAPGISRFEADGEREKGLGYAARAIRAALLVIFPVCAGLILFAGDAMAVFNPEFREYRHVLRLSVLAPLAGPPIHIGAGLAVALGAFRGYLASSIVFVVSAVTFASILVPRFGLTGAALAIPLGALVQQTALSVMLRRKVGFRMPSRVYAAWACGVGASAVSLWLDPGRIAAAAMLVGLLAIFFVVGRVSFSELSGLGRQLLGGGRREGRDE